MRGVLRIKDLAFEVDTRTSEFFAYVPQEPPGHPSPGRLRWSFEVRCVEEDHERGLGAPYLHANGLTLDVRDWRTIEGRTVRDGGGERLEAYLYVRVDHRTSDNSLRFVSRRRNLFTVEWECLADVSWDDGYDSGLPLRLDTEVAFDGVHVWWIKADEQGLAAAKELVGRHFDVACLQEPETAGPYHIVLPPRLNPEEQAPAK